MICWGRSSAVSASGSSEISDDVLHEAGFNGGLNLWGPDEEARKIVIDPTVREGLCGRVAVTPSWLGFG
jgi:hypothetical protein